MKTDYQYEYCDLITIQINETETFENIVSVPLKENSEFVQLGEYFAINKMPAQQKQLCRLIFYLYFFKVYDKMCQKL